MTREFQDTFNIIVTFAAMIFSVAACLSCYMKTYQIAISITDTDVSFSWKQVVFLTMWMGLAFLGNIMIDQFGMETNCFGTEFMNTLFWVISVLFMLRLIYLVISSKGKYMIAFFLMIAIQTFRNITLLFGMAQVPQLVQLADNSKISNGEQVFEFFMPFMFYYASVILLEKVISHSQFKIKISLTENNMGMARILVGKGTKKEEKGET